MAVNVNSEIIKPKSNVAKFCECSNAYGKKKDNISEINREKPYKEIEAVINDNRVVMRIQKLSKDPEDEARTAKGSSPSVKAPNKIRDDSNQIIKLKFPKISATSLMRSAGKNAGVVEDDQQQQQLDKSNSKELIKSPDMFLLKIKKRSQTWDKKKENIDLEFRTPNLS